MKYNNRYITQDSLHYFYNPSLTALKTFLYPLQCGHYICLPGYSIHREPNAYNSFLLLYVESGQMTLKLHERSFSAKSGDFLLIDCYDAHTYSTTGGCQCLWLHFDGPVARPYYESTVAQLGNIFSPADSYSTYQKLNKIFQTFHTGAPIREPLISKYITDLLTTFLLNTPKDADYLQHARMSEEVISYINEHLSEDLTVEQLANHVGLSVYHFIRTFKKETGFTPHNYLQNTRLAMARYLLANSSLSIKDICFSTGFSGESVFCTAFKKNLGVTPAEYRAQTTQT